MLNQAVLKDNNAETVDIQNPANHLGFLKTLPIHGKLTHITTNGETPKNLVQQEPTTPKNQSQICEGVWITIVL